MIIHTDQFIVDTISIEDYENIVDLYNTNTEFLEKHLGLTEISREWLESELESMKEIDFVTYKIVDRNSGKLLGIFDFKSDTNAYLSILILHKDCKGKGVGSHFIETLFTYLKSIDTISIHIDVVTGYNPAVMNFWNRHGFQIVEEIELNWNDNILPAVTMKKYL
jgi:ribosomal protein S18 acetylase RimI-like enzyme